MEIKNKIIYDSLVKSSKKLVENNNFKNNQNYIISNFTRFKFQRAYYKNWFQKHVSKLITSLFFLWFFTPFLTNLLSVSFSYEAIFWFYTLLWFLFVLLMFSIIFEGIIYFFYKKINFILWTQKFVSNRYIFLKRPTKKWYILNRRDFISFK